MRVLVFGLFGLAVVTGCGANAAAPAEKAGVSADKIREREHVIATCMKQKGFAYAAQVSQPKKEPVSADYATMKEQRAKHGFGVFSAYVYPRPSAEAVPDPNQATIDKLPAGQKDAYRTTMNECRIGALRQVYGLKVTSVDDYYDQMSKAIEGIDKELNGDPKLVELAAPFAECLKAKGERVASGRPGDLSVRGSAVWGEQADKLAKNGKVSAEAARPYLVKEIRSALADLECGKDFYAAYIPLSQRLNNEARVRFGFSEQ
ncbi:hypothetical protein [Nonomuraea typhae]|uniref:hypothetical protein n=1 Tax=Nonomuraea typhae TaxID=2603600 RepID=UPI0012F74D20|nr:hypothetical protein [Nonomuraea typhae]